MSEANRLKMATAKMDINTMPTIIMCVTQQRVEISCIHATFVASASLSLSVGSLIVVADAAIADEMMQHFRFQVRKAKNTRCNLHIYWKKVHIERWVILINRIKCNSAACFVCLLACSPAHISCTHRIPSYRYIY